jgi:large subunit ribosomal protein L13
VLQSILRIFAAPKKYSIVDSLSYKTISATKANAGKIWVVVDAKGLALGRLASHVAFRLRGKHKPNYTPHVDCGDNVIVINAAEVTLSGKKMNDKQYIRYTGYPGGQRFSTPAEELAKHPSRIVEKAVRGMLPKTRLGAELFRNLHVYAGAEHAHEAQQPVQI